MIKKILTLSLILLPLLLLSSPLQAQNPNLLRNPGFEGDYFAWNGIPEVQVAHDWTPWWIEDTNREPRWHRPEWKRANAANFPQRVYEGGSAQQWFTFYASHYAGMYQQVSGVTPGKTYRFSVWVQLWSSLEDDPNNSVSPANPRLQIGIEPGGQARPGFASPPSSIVWSYEASMDAITDSWALMSVEATAQSDTITVYLRTNPDFANKHNDIYIDNASLVLVGDPPPPPTNTPLPPTATSDAPPPTATADVPPATATLTPIPPTATPEASPTSQPSNTPEPTATSEPSPTATATAEPSPTSEPTATVAPSLTPTAEPTETAGATAVAQVTDPEPTAEPEPAEPGPSDSEGAPGDGLPPLLITLLVGGLVTLLGFGLFIWRRRS